MGSTHRVHALTCCTAIVYDVEWYGDFEKACDSVKLTIKNDGALQETTIKAESTIGKVNS